MTKINKGEKETKLFNKEAEEISMSEFVYCCQVCGRARKRVDRNVYKCVNKNCKVYDELILISIKY